MRRAFSTIELVLLLTIIFAIVALALPMINRKRDLPRRMQCASNLRQIGLAIQQYRVDYSASRPDTFPAARQGSKGWMDLVLPYLKNSAVFQCPSTMKGAPSTTDYFYNSQVAQVNIIKFRAPMSVILGGDGLDNAPSWNTLSLLPTSALTNGRSPAQRHMGGANYLFVDGHLKWIQPKQMNGAARWSVRWYGNHYLSPTLCPWCGIICCRV